MSDIVLPYNYKPRFYQLPAWKYMQGTEEGKRAACVWHRRAGKDLFGINVVSVKAQERVGTYWHLLPTYKQGRAIVWNGSTRDGRQFLDHFHPDLVAAKNNTEMRVTFQNGSHYQVVGTDDVNSLVGTNPIGCIFSEYSLHDPAAWNYLRPILKENGGWALFIYTARGHNHGYELIEMAKGNTKWFSQILVAGSAGTKRSDNTPVFSDEDIDEERRSGMPEEMVQQEYFCSFDASMVGAYYGSQMRLAESDGRIMDYIPHDPRISVDTFWDLGMDDTTSIWFAQFLNNEVRIIDYYENSGEGLAHYVKMLRGQIDDGSHRLQYLYGRHYGPHDLEVRDLSGNGQSRRELMKSLGVKFNIVKKHEVVDGIEAVRSLIPRCFFSMKNCARGVEALRTYRKQYDEKRKTFLDHPLHDWSSNGADAFRMMAMGHKESRRDSSPYSRQQTAVDDHDYLMA